MYHILFLLLKIVPMSILSLLAQFVAFFLCLFKNNSLYRSTNINIMLVRPTLSDSERQNLAKKSITNQLISTVDSAKCWVMPPAWSINQIKHVHHYEILKKALDNPNGLLIIAPHIGTWEMMNAWVAKHKPLTIMYKPTGNADMDILVRQGREKLNATLVPTDTTGVKAIFKALKGGGCSVILPDHVPDRHGGEIVPFFDVPTLTGTLAPKLISKTNCALVGLACIKEKDGFHIYCYDLNDEKLYNKDPIISTIALNRSMETMINAHFTHYMWGYRRFKYTPIAENLYLLDFKTIYHKRLEMENNND
ncbi:MAG: lipid A biosynthesis acyltransferase [Moraxella sp.]|uniref:lysophospholipid acyltransferase family protein n=1 Tax=Moraxella sp. TaxID=479 RepID=UPI0026DDA0A5|nr:lipid A biosynthesis acyltransferase [Moraxella sp.]MDO4449467.1 lipid A biosynthesis acyltransferase [Moraxella sp.]